MYSTRFGGASGTNNRPTMISAKYRQKEERRKMLKLSLNKLKRIDDPESSLCRSVLVNNLVKRLQKETREERKTLAPSQTKCFGITSDFISKQEDKVKPEIISESDCCKSAELLDITNIQEPSSTSSRLPAGQSHSLLSTNDCGENLITSTNSCKRSADHLDESDVLSPFYMPNTKSCLEDDEEDINVVDVETTPCSMMDSAKRRKIDVPDHQQQFVTAADRLRDNISCALFSLPIEDWCVDDQSHLQSPYTCGQSSMLNEIVVYRNLIASMES